ncbi:MAG: hypothetical protein GY786_06980 [Proteobacteria bacterium]|nr:hypothetical protein [Pseudomonadota bacterium]
MTQSMDKLLSGLARIGEAAKKDKLLKFNNLLHHITPELLEKAYFNLHSYRVGDKRVLRLVKCLLTAGVQSPETPKRWNFFELKSVEAGLEPCSGEDRKSQYHG